MTQDSFGFLTADAIRFGRGTAAGVAAAVAGHGRAVLLVHGAQATRSDWLRRDLVAAGCTVTAFACPREPDMALVEAAVASARHAAVSVVVSLGGGAVIDLAANGAVATGPAAARLAAVRGWIAAALGGAPDAAPQTLAAWSAAQGLPGLGAMGLDSADLPWVAAAAAGSSSMKANPVTLDTDTLERVLRAAF